MHLKHLFVAFLYLSSSMSFAQVRPERPRPERPAPAPRPEPRPERPTPRPERPPVRPERPERPPVRPERPERPPVRPERPERPPVRPPRPEPVRPPEHRPPAPRPPYDPYPPYYPAPSPRPPYEEQVMVYVSRHFYNYDRLDLDQYISMYQYRGYHIRSIEVSLDTYSSGGQFSLVLDGIIDRTHYMYSGWQNFVIYPNRYIQLGYNTHNVEFMIRGNDQVFVRHLILRMVR